MGWWPSSKVKAIAAEQGVGLLRNGAFSRLWGSQKLSQVAQNLLNFALIIRVFELAQHTRFANVSVALLVLSFGVPSIFFAAAAGIYVDHWNRKKVLIVANIVRAVLVLGYLFFEQNLIMVLLLSFLISTATQFFAPAEAASIPVLVGERQLLKANSLFIFTMYASFIFGYSGSAPVIAWFGPHGPYIVTAVMFGLATMLVTALPDVIPSLIELPWAAGEFASDTAFLTMNQVRMAFLIAGASDQDVGYREQRAQIAGIVAGAFGWRALARELAGKIPFGGGLIPKAAI